MKALALKRKVLWTYWAITVTIAMIIGVFTGIVFNFDPRLSLLAGYARDIGFIQDESVDLILTHPPYWGLVQYTDKKEDLSNMSFKDYLKSMKKVFEQCFRVLKEDKYCIFVIGDKRKSALVPIAAYFMHLGMHVGFNLWDALIYDTRFGGKQYNIYRQLKSKQFKFHLLDHDYVLIFQKLKRKNGWKYIPISKVLDE